MNKLKQKSAFKVFIFSLSLVFCIVEVGYGRSIVTKFSKEQNLVSFQAPKGTITNLRGQTQAKIPDQQTFLKEIIHDFITILVIAGVSFVAGELFGWIFFSIILFSSILNFSYFIPNSENLNFRKRVNHYISGLFFLWWGIFYTLPLILSLESDENRLLFSVLLIPTIFLETLFHEGGHAFVLKIFKIKMKIHWTRVMPLNTVSPSQNIFILMGGPLFQALFGLTFESLPFLFTSLPTDLFKAIAYIIYGNTLINLLPQNNFDNKKNKVSDGFQILSILINETSKKVYEQYSETIIKEIHRRTIGRGPSEPETSFFDTPYYQAA